MELVIATGNQHKLEELKPLFTGHSISLFPDFAFMETGSSFHENSMGKAKSLWYKIRKPVLADDSGLCVDALDGKPGVYSARFGSKNNNNLDSTERNEYLLKLMSGKSNRICRFICCMTLILDENRFYTVQETCEGVLLDTARGLGGFGYDPLVFIPDLGLSIAELSTDQKNKISHRGKASKRICAIIDSF